MNIWAVNISKIRYENGETQTELANALGIKQESVYQTENGKREVKARDIVEIAKHYNVSADWILGLSPVQSSDTTIKAVSEKTGLNQSAIETLASWKQDDSVMDVVNALLTDEALFNTVRSLITIADMDSDMYTITAKSGANAGTGRDMPQKEVREFYIHSAGASLTDKLRRIVDSLAPERKFDRDAIAIMEDAKNGK